MTGLWIAYYIGVLLHPIEFVRGRREARDERRTARMRRQIREEVARHFNLPVELWDEMEHLREH